MADRQSDDIRRRMIDAGRAKFVSDEYDVFAGLSISEVAEAANVSLRHARRLFTADSFREAMIEDVIRIHPEVDLSSKDAEEFTARVVDPDKSFIEELGDITNYVVEHNIQNPMMRATMALWALPRGSLLVERKMAELYARWLKDFRDGFNAMLSGRVERLKAPAERLSVDDFVRTMNAVVEGLAIQERPHRRLKQAGQPFDFPAGIEPMDPDLPRKVLEILFDSMTAQADQSCPHCGT